MKLKPTSVLDILGISSATICLVHCLIFPILTVLPFGILDNHWIDIAFSCIGMFVVFKVILNDTVLKVKYILGFSILFVLTVVVLEIFFGKDYFLVLFGGVGMIVGHILNFKSNKHQI